MRTYIIVMALLVSTIKISTVFAEVTVFKEYDQVHADTPWQITADSISYSDKDSAIIAKGDVIISRGNQTLYADEAYYNNESKDVTLSGNIRLESGEDIFRGTEGFFNLEDQTGRITNGNLFITSNHYYISGDVMEKFSEDSYLIKNCHVTSCDGEKPSWNISGSEVRVTIEGYGKVKHAFFRIRNIPVFYWPYLIFPAKTKRQTGVLLPTLGYSSRNGFGIEIPIFWAISDQTDATFYERFLSERGFMQGLEFRYKADNDSKGDFLFDIISDNVTPKDLSDPDQVSLSPAPRTNKTRYWFRSKTDQDLPFESEARLDLDYVSDRDYLKEFQSEVDGFGARPVLGDEFGRPILDSHSPTRRSALRLSRNQPDYSLQAIGEYNEVLVDPVDEEMPQPLAGLDFSLMPRQFLDLATFYSFDTNYDYIWRDEGQKGHRLSFEPGLAYPFWLSRFMQIEPSASYTGNIQWLADNPDIDHQAQGAFQFDTSVSTIMDKHFNFSWKKITKLKHKFTPALTYKYRVYNNEDQYEPWFEPINAEGNMNHIILSLDNFLDSRKENDKGAVSYTQVGTLKISQGYNLEEARKDEEPEDEKQPLEPLIGSLTFTPFPAIAIDTVAWWDHYINDFSYTDLSLGVKVDRSGGREDSYAMSYNYRKNGSDFLNYSIDFNLFHRYSIGTSLRRDMDLGKTIQSSYWINYSSQCWGVRLTTKTQDGASSIRVNFTFLGLGGFGTGNTGL
ncbi:LPS-assembly protein LptD [Thermodesulfobacteriota bacterium]